MYVSVVRGVLVSWHEESKYLIVCFVPGVPDVRYMLGLMGRGAWKSVRKSNVWNLFASGVRESDFFFFFRVYVLRRMGKNKA